MRFRLSRFVLISGWTLLLPLYAGCGSGERGEGEIDQPRAAVTANPADITPRDTELADLTPPPEFLPRFVNVAAESGIQFQFHSDTVPERFFLPEVMGGGAGWGDFDRDGWVDLYLMNGCRLETANTPDGEHRNQLFRNHAGRFVRVPNTAGAGHPGYGQGCAVGDFNADGFPDLFLANYGPNALLVNNGDGTFHDVSKSAGLHDSSWGTSAVWVDLDRDGDEDLYVLNYMNVTASNSKICLYNGRPGYCGPGEYDGLPDMAYLNQGDGTFLEASADLGFSETEGKGLAVVATDFNDDCQPDIYVANDMMANFLYTTDGPHPTYRDVAVSAGCAVSDEGLNEASMGIACADFDGDGRNDLFLTHYYQMKNTLYRNLGDFLFQDESRRSRIAATSFAFLGFGAWPLDYDLDGWPDLFVANGHVLGPGHEPNTMHPQLIRNEGGLRFTDVSSYSGEYFHQLWLGRGVAAADFDNDGDTDLAVTHIDRQTALLLNETDPRGHYFGILLETPERVRPVGARVVIRTAERTIVTVVQAGGSYLCESDPRLLVGLGPVDLIRLLEIHWPSGRVDQFETVDVDRYYRLVRGRGLSAL